VTSEEMEGLFSCSSSKRDRKYHKLWHELSCLLSLYGGRSFYGQSMEVVEGWCATRSFHNGRNDYMNCERVAPYMICDFSGFSCVCIRTRAKGQKNTAVCGWPFRTKGGEIDTSIKNVRNMMKLHEEEKGFHLGSKL
jgi:hypothetical protein